jgi:uncharacterized membrane protein
MSMSILFVPSHWRAFSVVGLTAIKSKDFAAVMILLLRVAGSSMVIVMRERKRMWGD